MVDPDQIQQYLNSVCKRTQAWWKPDAFIDEIDDSTWFEFGLKVKNKVPPGKKDEAAGEENLPKPVLKALDECVNKPILVIGSPGAGKSTFLAKALLIAAERALKNPDAPIPVLVKLNLYESGIWELIQSSLENHDFDISIEEIKQLVAEKKLLLVADGVNELPEETASAKLKEFCRRKIPMIFTTRDLGGDLGIEHKLELQPLSFLEVEQFLRDRLSLHDQKRVQELCDRVRDFGQTPLMVWMLYSIFQGTGEVPTTRGEAYRAFTNLYVEKAKEGISLDDSRSLLAKLAFEMMHSEKPTEPIFETEAQKLVGGEKNLNHLLKFHLLERQGHLGDRRIRFCHQSLQEYYAAEALLQKLHDISDYTLKRDYLNYLKWTEAIALMLGLPQITDEQAIRVVKLTLQEDSGLPAVDLMLGARLAGEAKPASQRKTVNLLNICQLKNGKCIPSQIKIKLLAKTKSDEAIPSLIKIIQDNYSDDGDEAVRALGEIGSDKAIDTLDRSLDHPKWNIGYAVVEALEEINTIEVLPVLLKAISHENTSVRCAATDVVAAIDSQTTIPILLKALRDEYGNVRKRAVAGLGKFHSKETFASLISSIRDEDYETRMTALWIIEKHNIKNAVPYLEKLIDDPWEDSFTQEKAAKTLKSLENRTPDPSKTSIVKPSRKSCQDSDLSSADFSKLWEALESSDYSTCLKARELIEKIGKSLLYKLLKTPYCNLEFGSKIANILNYSFSETVIPRLIEILDSDIDNANRQNAGLALAKIGLENIIPKLLEALKDWFPPTRWEAAELLGNLGLEVSIPALVEALHDEHDTVRQIAARAIGEIGSEIAVPALINSFQDDNEAVRWCAAEALSKIASKEALLALVQAWNKAIPSFDLVGLIEEIEKDTVSCTLPHLVNMISTQTDAYILRAISSVQSRCGFYNYEIAQSAAEEGSGVPGIVCGEKEQVMKTILVLASSPMNEVRLRLDKEVREIDEALRRSQKRDQFKLEQKWAVRADDLRRALLDIKPQIVHFCGHGSGIEGLLLEDETGQAKPVSTEALANLFELFTDQVECVVLNACYSDIQAKAIVQQIPYVIGMQDAVGDKTAIKFAIGFYDGLGGVGTDGNGYETVYKFGCNAVHLENLPGHLIPKLLKKDFIR